MNLVLELLGYTNDNVVKCIYDKSPLDFFASFIDDNILNQQIEILKHAWPNITKRIFVENVCSSSLEKRVWINRQKLILKCDLKLFLQNINLDDLNNVIKYSVLGIHFTNFDDAEVFFKNLSYPTLKMDFIPLIVKRCDPYIAGLKNNILYYVSKPPQFC